MKKKGRDKNEIRHVYYSPLFSGCDSFAPCILIVDSQLILFVGRMRRARCIECGWKENQNAKKNGFMIPSPRKKWKDVLFEQKRRVAIVPKGFFFLSPMTISHDDGKSHSKK